MRHNEIIFKLCNKESIVIELKKNIKEIHCCDNGVIKFKQEHYTYVLADDRVFSIYDRCKRFSDLLDMALSNKLQLHPSLITNSIKDIGYFFNESRQSKYGLTYDAENYWIGMKYMLCGAGEVVAWVYNDKKGTILFAITPDFTGQPTYRFDDAPLSEEEKENLAQYESWIKNYKPILMRTIPREIAQEWLNQANKILLTIEDNIKRLREEGRF